MVEKALFSSATPEWLTPKIWLDRVIKVMGAIDLDPCGESDSRSNVPARTVYLQEDDGLIREWHGRVFMNPPYGRGIGRWTKKLYDEWRAGRTVEAIALLPARVDTRWWQETVAEQPVCFVRGRIHFSGAVNSAPFPSAFVYYGPRISGFNHYFQKHGRVYLPSSMFRDVPNQPTHLRLEGAIEATLDTLRKALEEARKR